MKEQIIRLDAHDDYNSARDKMGWTQTSRLLLVWPPQGRVLSRRLDLLLLHRHANRLGAHLALITTDPAVRDSAACLGLPVFASLEDSRNNFWRSRTPRARFDRRRARPEPDALRGARRPRGPALPAWAGWTIRGLVFALGLGGLAALAIALLPAATIEVTPASRAIGADLEIAADPALSEVDGSQIPARVVRVEVEATGSTPTTGLRAVPSASAAGSVVFTSIDGTATVIPQGTGVRTTSGQPVRFRTTRTVTIEARIGATVEAAIGAVDLGPGGNVQAGLINAIDGPLGLQLAVTNLAPTAGGSTSQRPAVTITDRARLRAELLQRLEAEAVTAIENQLNPGEFLAYDSIFLDQTIAATYDLAAGEHADSVRLTLRISAAGIAVSESFAIQAGGAALRDAVPDGYGLVPGSERFERLDAARLGPDGRVHFSLSARGVVLPQLDRQQVRDLAAGKPPPQTRLHLARQLPLAGLPEISVWPAWYPRLPWLPFRIDVRVAAGG